MPQIDRQESSNNGVAHQKRERQKCAVCKCKDARSGAPEEHGLDICQVRAGRLECKASARGFPRLSSTAGITVQPERGNGERGGMDGWGIYAVDVQLVAACLIFAFPIVHALLQAPRG